MEGPVQKPFYEYVTEVEQALNTLNYLFGRNPWHEHQRIVGYLEGWLAGARASERSHER